LKGKSETIELLLDGNETHLLYYVSLLIHKLAAPKYT